MYAPTGKRPVNEWSLRIKNSLRAQNPGLLLTCNPLWRRSATNPNCPSSKGLERNTGIYRYMTGGKNYVHCPMRPCLYRKRNRHLKYPRHHDLRKIAMISLMLAIWAIDCQFGSGSTSRKITTKRSKCLICRDLLQRCQHGLKMELKLLYRKSATIYKTIPAHIASLLTELGRKM